jgi:hypothetical protein
MLMGLIAKDMVSSGQDEANVLPGADAPTMSAEGIFYAQMNGESIDPSMMQSKQSIVFDNDEPYDDIDDNYEGFSDACWLGPS